MGFVKIWVHLVWATKNREPLLKKEIREVIFKHIRENAQKKGIYLDFINGFEDHVHCLISLQSGQNIDNIVMLLKGESSYWINKNNLTSKRFAWQDQYYAVSISDLTVEKLREYIRKQEEHHKKRTFEEEFQEFIVKYKFEGKDLG